MVLACVCTTARTRTAALIGAGAAPYAVRRSLFRRDLSAGVHKELTVRVTRTLPTNMFKINVAYSWFALCGGIGTYRHVPEVAAGLLGFSCCV